MAFKIGKKDQERIDLLIAKLETKRDDLEITVGEFNETVNQARGKVDDALAELNEVRDELRGVVEDIHSQMESDFDDKSENWRDGDRGEATSAWIEVLSEAKNTIETEIEIEPVVDLEIDISDLEDAMNNIPSEPEY